MNVSNSKQTKTKSAKLEQLIKSPENKSTRNSIKYLRENNSLDSISEIDESNESSELNESNELNESDLFNNSNQFNNSAIVNNLKFKNLSDNEIINQLSLSWFKLNISDKNEKLINSIQKNVIEIELNLIKLKSKIDEIIESDLCLQKQFIICVKFLSLADKHMLKISNINLNLNYKSWFSILQDLKIKLLTTNQVQIVQNVKIIDDDLAFLETDFNMIKMKIQQNINNQRELEICSKIISKSNDKISKIKSNYYKQFNKFNFVLEHKYQLLVKVHDVCVDFLKLLDTLLPFFEKSNCNCDLVKTTIELRMKLTNFLANYKN